VELNEKLRFGLFDWIEASRRSPGEVYRHKLELAAAADNAGFHAYLVAEDEQWSKLRMIVEIAEDVWGK